MAAKNVTYYVTGESLGVCVYHCDQLVHGLVERRDQIPHD